MNTRYELIFKEINRLDYLIAIARDEQVRNDFRSQREQFIKLLVRLAEAAK